MKPLSDKVFGQSSSVPKRLKNEVSQVIDDLPDRKWAGCLGIQKNVKVAAR